MEKVNNMCEQMGNFKNFKSKLGKKKGQLEIQEIKKTVSEMKNIYRFNDRLVTAERYQN